jgi:hypothetical protein
MVIDVDEYPVYNPILRDKQLKSMSASRCSSGAESLGVLHVGTFTPRIFTHDEVELLQLVAERVAIAIERAQLHEELIQLDQLKLNFVAIASHELRTPATSVYGVLKTLSERGPDLNEELREELLCASAWSRASVSGRCSKELLDLSRLDARAITVEPRPVRAEGRPSPTSSTARLASSDTVDLDIPTISPPSSIRSCSSGSSRTSWRTRSATARRRSGSSRNSATGTSGSRSRTQAPASPRTSRGGSSTASPAAAASRATASVSRSPARTRRRTEETSSTTHVRAGHASSC